MSEDRLFERGEHGERHGATGGDNSPVEHQHLPEARKKDEKPPTIVFSFETEEEREQLVTLLDIKVNRSGGQWTGWYPEEPTSGPWATRPDQETLDFDV